MEKLIGLTILSVLGSIAPVMAQERDLDLSALFPKGLEAAPAAAGSCDGIGDGIWNGCRGTGCHVCTEKLTGFDCYFLNHPDCVLNTTCAGQFYSCDAACPPPTAADRCAATTCDGIGDGLWNGCRGNGCAVCAEKTLQYSCYLQNHPGCNLNLTCAGQFYSCDAACPPPTHLDICSTSCLTDTCFTCYRPAAGVDADVDQVPDSLEYDLAHQYFPAALLQGFDDDLEESYFYLNRAMPYTITPIAVAGTTCDETFECLELRIGLAYRYDTGDTFLGITSHPGDSEFYAVLVRRTVPWSAAQTNAASWQMIRDFTAAHWGETADSVQGQYSLCGPTSCSPMTQTGCNANPSYCSWFAGFCSGAVGNDFESCGNLQDQESCAFAGGSCRWLPAGCGARLNWKCYSSVPVTTARTLYVSEGKHGTYHTKGECDSGGLFGADACPFNQYNLRSYKRQWLQNVGSSAHPTLDTTMQHPNFCALYDVWGGAKFAGATEYSKHFNIGLSWVVP